MSMACVCACICGMCVCVCVCACAYVCVWRGRLVGWMGVCQGVYVYVSTCVRGPLTSFYALLTERAGSEFLCCLFSQTAVALPLSAGNPKSAASP